MGEAAAASWILFLIVAVLTRHLLPLAAALGPLPVTIPGSQAVAVTLARRRSGGLPARRTVTRRSRRTALYAILIIGGLLMMVPFFWMVITSLKTRAEVFGAAPLSLPTGAHWDNYSKMWNALPGVTFGTFFLNSLKLALLNTAGQLVTCSMAAYAFAAIPFRGRGPLFGLLLATLIIPTQVVLVPNFILWRSLPNPFSESGSFYGTQEPLWVGAWLGGAFGTFLLRQFFLAIPRSSPTRHASTARTRGRSSAGSTCRSPSPRSRRSRSSPSCGPGTTCSTR